MSYYLVWVRSNRYRGHEPLTYSSDQNLQPGQVVKVALQNEAVVGFVERAINKPAFKTKSIDIIYEMPPLPQQTIELARWLMAYYATNLGTATSQVLPAELSVKTIAKLETLNIGANKTTLPQLNTDQQAVVKNITKADTYLLHGKTGSGKTRVYIELAQQAVTAGKSALILTPEISLTSQLSQSFRDVFGEQVIVLHSQLTPAQRQKVWLKILIATIPLVVVGPRSALFSPLANLGLIVIDEAHEPAYKQEQAPYYHARSVASKLAELHQAPLIIGSATPSVSDYFLAEQRQKPILRMTQLATPGDTTALQLSIVDLKDRTQFTRSPRLSQALLDSIKASLGRGE